MTETTLLPCAHCGAAGQIKRGKTILVSCTACSASTFQVLGDQKSAITAWNQRSEQDAKDAARYRWLREQYDSGNTNWFLKPYGAVFESFDMGIDAAMKESTP